jgi:hypothetical protein
VSRCFIHRTHRNALCDPHVPPDAKTQVWGHVSLRALSGFRTVPIRARKIVHPCFTPWAHRNALRDSEIQPDAKHWFSTTCPGVLFMESAPVPHEHKKKIVHRRFMPLMHQNALLGPHIPPDAKTHVRRNMSRRAFYGHRTSPT